MDWLHKTLLGVLVLTSYPASWWLLDNRVELFDRTPPYTRYPDQAIPVDPVACGLPPGPTPERIRVGDCVTAKWVSVFHKTNCRVTPFFPYVVRWLIDEEDEEIDLPLVRSQFSNGVMEQVAGSTLGNKVFKQPRVTLGNVQYNANVRYICPLKSGMDNPIDWLIPRLVTSDPIIYRVWAN